MNPLRLRITEVIFNVYYHSYFISVSLYVNVNKHFKCNLISIFLLRYLYLVLTLHFVEGIKRVLIKSFGNMFPNQCHYSCFISLNYNNVYYLHVNHNKNYLNVCLCPCICVTPLAQWDARLWSTVYIHSLNIATCRRHQARLQETPIWTPGVGGWGDGL